jgi:hypothetical protein
MDSSLQMIIMVNPFTKKKNVLYQNRMYIIKSLPFGVKHWFLNSNKKNPPN